MFARPRARARASHARRTGARASGLAAARRTRRAPADASPAPAGFGPARREPPPARRRTAPTARPNRRSPPPAARVGGASAPVPAERGLGVALREADRLPALVEVVRVEPEAERGERRPGEREVEDVPEVAVGDDEGARPPRPRRVDANARVGEPHGREREEEVHAVRDVAVDGGDPVGHVDAGDLDPGEPPAGALAEPREDVLHPEHRAELGPVDAVGREERVRRAPPVLEKPRRQVEDRRARLRREPDVRVPVPRAGRRRRPGREKVGPDRRLRRKDHEERRASPTPEGRVEPRERAEPPPDRLLPGPVGAVPRRDVRAAVQPEAGPDEDPVRLGPVPEAEGELDVQADEPRPEREGLARPDLRCALEAPVEPAAERERRPRRLLRHPSDERPFGEAGVAEGGRRAEQEDDEEREEAGGRVHHRQNRK